MAEFSKEVLSHAKRFWSQQYGYELSDDETLEIVTNLTNYFEALKAIHQETKKEAEKHRNGLAEPLTEPDGSLAK